MKHPPSVKWPNGNYFEVAITLRIPTTWEEDSPSTRQHIENNIGNWISYLENIESKFVEHKMSDHNHTKELAELPQLYTKLLGDHFAMAIKCDNLLAALREISAQRNNRYESTVGIVCDIADKAIKSIK